jgi:hypothetical protein
VINNRPLLNRSLSFIKLKEQAYMILVQIFHLLKYGCCNLIYTYVLNTTKLVPGTSEVTVTAAGTDDKKGNLGCKVDLNASAILIGVICPDSNLYISG